MSSKVDHSSSYKPKLNITLGGSTYTKTLNLESNFISDILPLNNKTMVVNGFDTKSSNERSSPDVGATSNGTDATGPLNAMCNIPKQQLSDASAKPAIESSNFVNRPQRSTFFARLARRLTIKHTIAKPTNLPQLRADTQTSILVTEKPPPQIPTSRKIRRWFSKHLIPPTKSSPPKSTTAGFTERAATLDGSIDKQVFSSLNDFGSVPTRRRDAPRLNASEFSLCDSLPGAPGLANDPFEVGRDRLHQPMFPRESIRHNNSEAVSSIPKRLDHCSAHLSSAFSSPSVIARGPPPRYLNVSVAAFGYTVCTRKSASTQALGVHGNGPPISTPDVFLGSNADPPRHRSTSPAPPRMVQRPERLNLPETPTVTSVGPQLQTPEKPLKVSGQVSPTANEPSSLVSSGVTIRVKRGYSTSASATGAGEVVDPMAQDLNRSSHSHHEHWNRSSLIIIAVAQASPRIHNAPPSSITGPVPGITSPPSLTTPGMSETTFGPSGAASPSRQASARRFAFGEENGYLDICLPKLDEVPALVTDTKQEEEKESTEVPKSSEVESDPVVSRGSATAVANGHAPDLTKSSIRDGHYFLGVVEDVTKDLRGHVDDIERDLANIELSDEVAGQLRTTVGKVNLLVSKKFAQFRDLCLDSIETAAAVDGVGEFVTLPSDLEGFWAMVMLQVDDVRAMIALVDRLRQSGWQTDAVESPLSRGSSVRITTDSPNPLAVKSVMPRSRRPGKVTTQAGTPRPRQTRDASADVARSLARERLKAAKRQYMRTHQGGEEGLAKDSTDSAAFLVI